MLRLPPDLPAHGPLALREPPKPYVEDSSLDDPGFKSTQFFAKRLRISLHAFNQGVQAGKYPPHTFMCKRKRYWDNKVILNFLNGR